MCDEFSNHTCGQLILGNVKHMSRCHYQNQLTIIGQTQILINTFTKLSFFNAGQHSTFS